MSSAFPAFFPYHRPPELDGRGNSHRRVVIAGAGPVGLTMALDWALRGHSVLVLTASTMLSEGSRAICFAKRTLEIFDRLGCCDPVVGKGVSWNLGKVFMQDRLLYEFDLLPETGHQRPAFVNLQQYYVEHFLLEALARHAAAASPTDAHRGGSKESDPIDSLDSRSNESDPFDRVDVRWNNRVVGVTQTPERVEIMVECPDGTYALQCDWLIACDGASSPIRKMLGLKSEGQVFQDRFLIADVKMHGASLAKFKSERWFWFDPPFHRNQSALLHKQADDVWRLDFQLGWQADPELERQPERVNPRIRAMLGDDVDFTLEWVSVYTFQCRRMDRFIHDRVIFAGDAAHQVSPFGARGANSGIQDADNLGWKLDLVVRGISPRALLETYNDERVEAAEENIRNSTRSTDFITPKSDVSRTFRDATLELAARYPFARRLVNSGRLSVPTHHADSPLNTPDVEAWPGPTPPGSAASGAGPHCPAPGSPALDAPIVANGRPDWLLRHLGRGFAAVVFARDGQLPADTMAALRASAMLPISVTPIIVTRAGATMDRNEFTCLLDDAGIAFARYAPDGDAIYLLRPDQHVAARRHGLYADWLGDALRRATLADVPFTLEVD